MHNLGISSALEHDFRGNSLRLQPVEVEAWPELITTIVNLTLIGEIKSFPICPQFWKFCKKKKKADNSENFH